MWTQSTSVTDRQTDGQTDGRTDRITITDTVQRIASHGKNTRITMLELGSRQNVTGMETERARGKCVANALVGQLC